MTIDDNLAERIVSEPVTRNGYTFYDIERPVYLGAHNSYKLCRFRILKDSKNGKLISEIYLSGLGEEKL